MLDSYNAICCITYEIYRMIDSINSNIDFILTPENNNQFWNWQLNHYTFTWFMVSSYN